jgi:hypothetical protein
MTTSPISAASTMVPAYRIEPLIPRRLQIELRRKMVLAKRSVLGHVWPIDPNAGQPPKGWSGWPEGKRLALVLTHDVEGPKGVASCLRLADVDRAFGFRSCLNFVPESCRVLETLRHSLLADGFEIGVHGLCHDGNLFYSRTKFEKMSGKIKAYLNEWRSEDFRTPSM